MTVDNDMDEIDSALSKPVQVPNIKGMINLKRQLRLYLDLRGMTAAELSRKSGVSKQVISLWLSSAQPKRIEQVKRVADALGTTVDNLCFGSGVDQERERATELDALLGDDWVSGLFEVKLRRVKRGTER